MTATSLIGTGTLNRTEPPWRREQRLVALDWLTDHAGANPDETWRFTPIAKILDRHRDAPANDGTSMVHGAPGLVRAVAGPHRQGPVLVFVDGRFDAALSDRQLTGSCLVNAASSCGPEVVVPAALETPRPDSLLAWNQAAAVDATVVSVEGATAGTVHIVHLRTTQEGAAHPRTVVDVAENAEVTVVETFLGGGSDTLTNTSTTLRARAGSTLRYYRVQDESRAATHVGHVRLDISTEATATATVFSFGAATARLTVDATLDGSGASVDLAGLYMPRGDQRHDHLVTVEHRGTRGRSAQHFRGVIDDRARGAFTGHIIVPPGSSRSEATQVNRNLLLTPTARAITQPWLEILNDDVSCDHGATVGRLDDEALFYLRSRGISEHDARAMLTDAFASVIVELIAPGPLRDHVAGLAARRHEDGTQ